MKTFSDDNKVRKTVWKEKFTHFLPIYIDDDHFNRGLPLIERSIAAMSGNTTFRPHMVLDVLPKFLNTLVVLLMDKGVFASQKALDGYWAIHRLFIALVRKFPELSNMVSAKVAKFVKDPESRVKSSLPSLGNFLPLLSVSERIGWKSVSWLYISENFDRNVLWIGKADQVLLKHKSGPADLEWLKKVFNAVKISHRLALFHVHFLRMNAGRSLDAVAAEYDMVNISSILY
jgi:hypothetical protein